MSVVEDEDWENEAIFFSIFFNPCCTLHYVNVIQALVYTSILPTKQTSDK